MIGSQPIEQPTTFVRVDTVTNDGVVVAFGEEWSPTPAKRKLWYRVLDLEQTADQDLETAWEDATRWTRWYEVTYPTELRAIGMSLFDVERSIDQRYATVPGRWKAIDDGDHIYLFRALDLTTDLTTDLPDDAAPSDAIRVYATRYRLTRATSPDAGTNRGAKGQDVTVPQLLPVREARYRRSAVRESPFGDTDSQGTRDLGNNAFVEPAMEFSMLRPANGAFTVTLAPSNLPGRMRWQFFCGDELTVEDGGTTRTDPAIAAYSILRDDDGWADLDEKFDLLNDDPDDRFRIRADRVFTLVDADDQVLQMAGQPASTTFRLQEQNTPLASGSDGEQEEGRALSGQRVMLAMRAGPLSRPAGFATDVTDRLVVVDFTVDDDGKIQVGDTLKVPDVDFARSAMWLNSIDDRVKLTDAAEQTGSTFAVQTWVRHDEGSGTLLARGWDPGVDVGGWADEAASDAGAESTGPVGWSLEWDAGRRRLAGMRVMGPDGGRRVFRVEAPVPGSFTWHHLALVQSETVLALYIDGALAAEQPIDFDGAGGVTGEITVGGPGSDADAAGWVDVRIDQVVLTASPRQPSLDTIYLELDQAAQDAADTLGYWTFDRAGSAEPVGYAFDGADEVSQTAPLFPPDKQQFELELGGMSTGMGLITAADHRFVADPHLFIGADGVVRLYLAAAAGNFTAASARELAYDTTSARAQFSVPWVAAGEQSERRGELVLQAREPGPIMNRAVVVVEETGDTRRLSITHPHRDPEFGETWSNLPAALADLITVLDGKARAKLPGDPEPEPGVELPLSYDYYNDGPRRSSEPYSSDVVQAMAASVPDNGAEAIVQAGAASLRQQGNFTGWTQPPLMVSGSFGDVVASADLTQDEWGRLRVPGDFAVEAWIDPYAGEGLQRIVNWHQGINDDGDVDGFALVVDRPRQFGLSSDGEFSSKELLTGDRAWFGSGGGVTLTARLRLPEGGGGGRADTVSTVEVTNDVVIDVSELYGELKRLRNTEISGLSGDAKTDAEAELADWKPPENDVTVQHRATARLGVSGRSIVCTWSGALDDEDLEDPAKTVVQDWKSFVEGKDVSPAGQSWTVSAPAGVAGLFDGLVQTLFTVPVYRNEGEPIDVVVTIEDVETPAALAHASGARSGARPGAVCTIDGLEAAVSDPDPDTPWLIGPSGSSTGSFAIGDTSGATDPFTGVIHQMSTSVGSSTTHTIDLDSKSQDPAWNGYFTSSTLVFEPNLGDRRYRTRQVQPAQWGHVGIVCSDNFATRFEEDGDRAVINDSDGLNPDREFTIDCVVVREIDDAMKDDKSPRAIFSKAVEIGDDRAVTFRLSIDGSGHAMLQFDAEINGAVQSHEVRTGQVLQVDRPYHIIASVKLEEIYYPDKPNKDGEPKDEDQRWQYWVLHRGVWVYDIVGATWLGNEVPTEFTALPADVNRAWLASFLQSLGWGGWPLQFILGSGPTAQRYLVLSRAKDIDAIHDATLRGTTVPAAIGAATGEDPNRLPDSGSMQWFKGLIGSVRMWRSALPKTSLDRLPLESALPGGVAGPAASWAFDENRGLQATDSAGGMTATLTREEQWVTTRATARLTVYWNGRALPLTPVSGGNTGYGDADRFTVGGMIRSGAAAEIFDGSIDEVRVWRDLRTGEEMLDSMHTRFGGGEDDLTAWWPMSAGIGLRVKDASIGGQNDLHLVGATDDFWQREAAPVGDDLPQVPHLFAERTSTWTANDLVAAPMAAEYGDIQTDASGRIAGVQKRALVVAGEAGWLTATGFKTGDLDLIYVGQAQSDPTLIGYIEGAPPIPSENLTRPYWQSAFSYDAYNDRTSVVLRQAENTTTSYSANYDRGFDMSVSAEVLFSFLVEFMAGIGFAWGGFGDTEADVTKIEMDLGGATSFELGLGWLKQYETGIGTTRSTSNRLGLAGNWEPMDAIANPQVGRRYVPDNTGYALVKSGVANVYAMRLRRNGAMLGLTMVPDPDIPEDFNIISFKVRPTYTKQGTLDGRIGLSTDPDWRLAAPGRGSYFRPLEAANLEAQIDAYEAKLLAAYDSFDSGGKGRRSAGRHFGEDDPAQDPKNVVEGGNIVPHDWERNLSKRNIVNTYVWTASGGFFAEETGTTIVRSESSGGSYSFKGMAGLKFSGKVGVGFGALVGGSWDVSAMFGGHITTTVMKTKAEGRDFGLDVTADCDGLLERYTGSPGQLYSGVAEPGKVSSYRFKSFYLVPEKSHFEDFWSRVVDDDWLESDDLDAVALRQARANQNHVWRVLHRVTYVQRVPPTGDRPLPEPERSTKTVVHQGPNWQNLKLALDVLRTGQTSDGTAIGALGIDEQLAAAADDLVRAQWGVLSPWWAAMVASDPDSPEGEVVAELRRRTYEYLRAYEETGLLALDPRLTNGPTPALDGPDDEPPPDLPPLTSLAEGAADALHLFTFDRRSFGIDQKGGDFLEYTAPASIVHTELPPGVGGRLLLPGPSAGMPAGRAKISLSGDWGRVAPRTWEVCFRLSEAGPAVVLAPTTLVPEVQRPFRWLAVDNERRDGKLAIWPIGATRSVSLPGFDVDTVDKLVYLAIGYTPPVAATAAGEPATEAALEIAWAVEGAVGVQRRTVPTVEGDLAGGPMSLGGSGREQFGHEMTRGSLEVLHLAVHDEVFDAKEIARRTRAVGLEP